MSPSNTGASVDTGDLFAGIQRPEAHDGEPVLRLRDLGVAFRVDDEWVMASEHVDFAIAPGEVLAVVGESGSGKSVSAMSVLGLLPGNARVTGSATLLGRELIGARESTLRAVRGKDVGLIFQEPMSALNPVLTVGFQIGEVLLSHFDLTPEAARVRVLELMRLVDLPDPEERYNRYPHQLSGGQRQRVVIAMALACDPVLLLADEPTTALDVTVQAEILDLLRDLHRRLNSAILLITHDMGVVADLADRVVVMRSGSIVETGTVRSVFASPQHPYTRDLLAAVPHLGATVEDRPATVPAPRREPAADTVPALEIRNLVIEYPGRGRRVPAFRAVDDVSFSIGPGEILGLVGESGSGKTTIGRAVASLLPTTAGEIRIAGTNIRGLSQKQLRPMRKRVAIVFQDPASSLNPRMTIGESIGEPLRLHTPLRGKDLDGKVEALLESVRLPQHYRNRYPHELSGGQRQRVGIARALSLEPALLIADEPTSALDVSVQARVLDLLQDLQREFGFACLFISHDLAVVEILADQIAVLHRGKLAEIGSREQILTAATDPYTQRLIAAAPVPDPAQQEARRDERRALLAAGSDEQDPASRGIGRVVRPAPPQGPTQAPQQGP
ncbi:ABC transporter ATP-binding protein [Nakamurella flavida]|uniref:ABC transporter ATP-binding protein n=1 Tax=Nakamurella flavida TaxID=363630 RepID=A0A939C681_9ACTN|nr:ABC transporter ATP-binding protein [Nakamurella flavida]MBM9476942.1 ABC transporter ATP-binding protein [Nakamurella flavida]MDP9779887.1 peptide/nickel transport system ATP-binding protein [Nakamurella flavida]